MKPLIPVTLIAVDTTSKPHLAARAIEKCLAQAHFSAVKLLTHDMRLPNAVKIEPLRGLDAYSNFMVRDLWRHVDTSHALIVQYDGYVLNALAWQPGWLRWDYMGAPFGTSKRVGNGGFSLRSKKLLVQSAQIFPGENAHPEDAWLCMKRRAELERRGLRFATYEAARNFAFEGRSFNGREWSGLPTSWDNQFGFHSWLTPLPTALDKPMIFHHSGDTGDVIYALPVMKALGGGVLFVSGDNRYPYPRPSRWQQQGAPAEWATNLASLCEMQPYVWRVLYTHGLPYSVDVDFNCFREFYHGRRAENWWSLFRLHQEAVGVTYPEDEPWLTVDQRADLGGRDIIVNRTARFQNPSFPWKTLVERYGERMLFVGTLEEHAAFYHYGRVPWLKTGNLLEVARAIAGAKVFMGNQSCPMAIALGLGANVVQEVWRGNANCKLQRKNALYVEGNTVEIPEGWL